MSRTLEFFFSVFVVGSSSIIRVLNLWYLPEFTLPLNDLNLVLFARVSIIAHTALYCVRLQKHPPSPTGSELEENTLVLFPSLVYR